MAIVMKMADIAMKMAEIFMPMADTLNVMVCRLSALYVSNLPLEPCRVTDPSTCCEVSAGPWHQSSPCPSRETLG